MSEPYRSKDFFESPASYYNDIKSDEGLFWKAPVVGTKTFAVTLKKIRDWSQSNFSSLQMTKKEKRQTALKNEAGWDGKHFFNSEKY